MGGCGIILGGLSPPKPKPSYVPGCSSCLSRQYFYFAWRSETLNYYRVYCRVYCRLLWM